MVTYKVLLPGSWGTWDKVLYPVPSIYSIPWWYIRPAALRIQRSACQTGPLMVVETTADLDWCHPWTYQLIQVNLVSLWSDYCYLVACAYLESADCFYFWFGMFMASNPYRGGSKVLIIWCMRPVCHSPVVCLSELRITQYLRQFSSNNPLFLIFYKLIVPCRM